MCAEWAAPAYHFGRYLSAPTSMARMIAGKTLAGFTFRVLVSPVSLLVGVAGYGTDITPLSRWQRR